MRDSYLFVTAHKREAKALAAGLKDCIAGPLPYRYSNKTFSIIVSGAGEEKTKRALASLSFDRFKAAINFGIAGSLIRLYAAGMLLECPWVYERSGVEFSSLLQLGLPRASLITVDTPVLTPEERETLYRRTGAVAVDMEAAAFAGVMEENRCPWAVVKMISDTPEQPDPFLFSSELDRLLVENARSVIRMTQEELS